MIDDELVECYIKAVTEESSSDVTHKTFMIFICSCLEFVREFLPPVAQDAFETAKGYWFRNSGTVEALESARVACWKYLDGKGSSVGIGDREDTAIRALLCSLYPVPPTDDFSADTVRWFTVMLNKLGDFSAQVGPLLERCEKWESGSGSNIDRD